MTTKVVKVETVMKQVDLSSEDLEMRFYLVSTPLAGGWPASIVHIVKGNSEDDAVALANKTIFQSGRRPTGTDKVVELNMSDVQEVLHCDACTGIWQLYTRVGILCPKNQTKR